jgi:hypothetical protein
METMTTKKETQIKNGPAAAALLAGGIGAVAYGIFIILAEGIKSVGSALNWYNPSGNLSGKTGMMIIVWLASWAVLNNQWKDKDVDFQKMSTIAIVLLLVGVLLTVPPVFDFFIHLIGG